MMSNDAAVERNRSSPPGSGERRGIASFAFEHQARLCSQMFRAQGFDAEVSGAPLFGLSVAVLSSDAFRVSLPVDQLEAGRALLAAVDRDYRPEVPASIPPEDRRAPCLACGGSDKVWESWMLRNRAARLGFVRRGLARAGDPYDWRCLACDHRW